MSGNAFSGGCQCGAVRFRATRLGRPSICHCRMCQKQFGSFFGAFVTAYEDDLAWIRGKPAYFRSSAEIERGFCARCGTPLTYRHPGGIELSIGSFDHPEALEPEVQVNHEYRLPWIEKIFAKPLHESSDTGGTVSYQHPDHDTEQWPPVRTR
jgi:hypothetical protein